MLKTLLEVFGGQTNVGQSRTATTNPIQWTLAIVLLGLVVLFFAHVPIWLLIVFTCSFVAILLMFCYAYLHLLKRNPDALRSERYVLEKLALQSRLTGDSDTGTTSIVELPKEMRDGGRAKLTLGSDAQESKEEA